MDGKLISEDIGILRETILANDGTNVARGAFARKVDGLIGSFYEDVGELTDVPLGDILDLFLIKVLYVERGSRDAGALLYIGEMLRRLLSSHELVLDQRGTIVPYLSDLLQEVTDRVQTGPERFASYRRFGDNALFLGGIFPQGFGRRRRAGRLGGSPFVDRAYFIANGRRYYEMAAGEELAEQQQLRLTLLRLAQFFEVYVDALNEMSGRYVLGMDMRLLADKMLDAFNRYRSTGEAAHLSTARNYASLLRLGPDQWPALGACAGAPPTYF